MSLYLNATSRCSFMDTTCRVTRSEYIPPGILRMHLRGRVNRYAGINTHSKDDIWRAEYIYSTIFHELFIWRLEIIHVTKNTHYVVFFSDSYFLVTCHILRILSKLNTFCSAFLSHMQKRQIIVYFTLWNDVCRYDVYARCEILDILISYSISIKLWCKKILRPSQSYLYIRYQNYRCHINSFLCLSWQIRAIRWQFSSQRVAGIRTSLCNITYNSVVVSTGLCSPRYVNPRCE